MKKVFLILLLFLSSFCFAENEIIISDGDIGIKFKMQNDTVVVTGFRKDSPAKTAGLEKGDRIIKVNESEISGVGLPEYLVIEKLRGCSGSLVDLVVRRGNSNEEMNFNIKRIENLSFGFSLFERSEFVMDTLGIWTIEDISSDKFSTKFMTTAEREVTVGNVIKGGVADSLGLEKLDRIIKINNRVVYNENSINNFLREYNNSSIRFTVERDSLHINFTIPYNNSVDFFELIGINKEKTHLSNICWMRYCISTNLLHEREYLLYLLSGNAELYIPTDDGSFVKKISGESYNYDDRDFKLGKYIFLSLKLNNETKTFYLKIEHDFINSIIGAPYKILSQEYVIYEDRKFRLGIGLFFGIMIIMAIYNLILFFFIRDNSYIYYALYIFSFGINLFLILGYAFELLWPQNPEIDKYSFNMIPLMLIFFVLFGKNYLKTKIYLPRWNKVIIIQIYLIVFVFIYLILAANFIKFQIMGVKLYIMLVVLTLPFFIILIPSIILSYRRNKPAQYFLVANLALIIGLILIIVTDMFIFPPLSVVVQIVVFSIGLGEQIRLTEMKKKKAQVKVIEQLTENEKLKDKVNRELEQKVKERTSEITQQNEEITAQRDEIEAQRDLVMNQKEKIEEVNEELTDSINYAKYIQNAILPQEDYRGQLLPEHFIFFKPKNIVSGDFYWLTKVEGRIIVAAADCTGHGVPGAFMSMLGVSFLNDVVNKEYITHPGVILRRLRKEVIYALQQKGEFGEQRDGMDIAICSIDFENLELQFSGANNPLYLIRDKEKESITEARIYEDTKVNLYEIKGDNMPIAIHERMDKFRMHEIKLFKGDCLYMFSDGFADQFGGDDGKKFKYKPFKNLLLNNAHKPMHEQINILKYTFSQWQGNYEQVDDIVVIGIKI